MERLNTIRLLKTWNILAILTHNSRKWIAIVSLLLTNLDETVHRRKTKKSERIGETEESTEYFSRISFIPEIPRSQMNRVIAV